MDKAGLKIDWATHKAAKYACENWHYSKTMPVNKTVKMGVWEYGIYKGCVVYSCGSAGVRSINKTYGIKKGCVVELARVALRDHIFPVSKIVALTLKILKRTQENIRLVVSYADPQQDHVGVIYQSMNWIYIGRSSKDFVFIDTIGKRWHSRSVSESGWKVHCGVRRKCPKPSSMTRVSIPPKYKYLYPLDAAMREQILPLSKPYPKRAVSIENDAPAIQQDEGGVIPTTALHE